eukprot:2386531-Rhodomonas_salina.1
MSLISSSLKTVSFTLCLLAWHRHPPSQPRTFRIALAVLLGPGIACSKNGHCIQPTPGYPPYLSASESGNATSSAFTSASAASSPSHMYRPVTLTLVSLHNCAP